MRKLKDLEVLALDTYRKTPTAFSVNEANDAVRKAVNDACGGEWNYYNFMKNQWDVYQIIADIMLAPMNASLGEKFSGFADFIDTAMGDENNFIVEDNALFPVYSVSRGSGDVARQKISGRSFSVSTINKEIKFYDEFDRFMAGKVDFSTLTDRAIASYMHYVGQLIAETIYGSYASVNTNNKSTGAYDADTLATIIEHTKAATGADRVQIWGTTTSLGYISDGFGYSDGAKDQANQLGFYGNFRGTDLVAFPQAYKPQSTTFVVNDAHIIVLPAGEKIVKVAFEGAPVVATSDPMARSDRQIEFVYGRRVGAAAIVVPDNMFGFYKFT